MKFQMQTKFKKILAHAFNLKNTMHTQHAGIINEKEGDNQTLCKANSEKFP